MRTASDDRQKTCAGSRGAQAGLATGAAARPVRRGARGDGRGQGARRRTERLDQGRDDERVSRGACDRPAHAPARPAAASPALERAVAPGRQTDEVRGSRAVRPVGQEVRLLGTQGGQLMATESVWAGNDTLLVTHMTRGAVPWAYRPIELTAQRVACGRCGRKRQVKPERGFSPLCKDCLDVTTDLGERQEWVA